MSADIRQIFPNFLADFRYDIPIAPASLQEKTNSPACCVIVIVVLSCTVSHLSVFIVGVSNPSYSWIALGVPPRTEVGNM